MRRALILLIVTALATSACGSTDEAALVTSTTGEICDAQGTGSDDSSITLDAEATRNHFRDGCTLVVHRVAPETADDIIRDIGCPDAPQIRDPDECDYVPLAGLQVEPSPLEFKNGTVEVSYDLQHDDTPNTAECKRLAAIGERQGLEGKQVAECDGEVRGDGEVAFAIFTSGERWSNEGSATANSRDQPEVASGEVTHFSILWLTAIPAGRPLGDVIASSEAKATQIRSDFEEGATAGSIRVSMTFSTSGSSVGFAPNGDRELLLSLEGDGERSLAELNEAFSRGTGVVVQTTGNTLKIQSLDGGQPAVFPSASIHVSDA